MEGNKKRIKKKIKVNLEISKKKLLVQKIKILEKDYRRPKTKTKQ